MSRTSLQQAANTFRHWVLALEGEGEFLGSERELTERLNVSRPTFRQVARLLEQEQLISIRRGPGGGFFSRKPSFDGIAHMMSIYLVAQRARLSDMLQVGRPLLVDAACLAATSGDDIARRGPWEFLRSQRAELDSRAGFARHAIGFNHALVAISTNPMLEIFMQIIQEFAGHFDSLRGFTAGRARRYLSAQRRLALAIREGDPEIAAIMAGRMSDELAHWVLEDPDNQQTFADLMSGRRRGQGGL
jgi:DNA-binding FadR family transcriptional regulator